MLLCGIVLVVGIDSLEVDLRRPILNVVGECSIAVIAELNVLLLFIAFEIV